MGLRVWIARHLTRSLLIGMSSSHPSYPSPGPSSYYHNPPPPPPQYYGNGQYYHPYMPPMNGPAPMHQPASPRINSPGRGRYPTQAQRGGMPNYQHYPPSMPPPPHGLHPGAAMQSPPISPVNPYTHPHVPKYAPHVPHVPYSPTYHPQPNGGYHPGWSQPPPLPKQLPMLSPAMRSPNPVLPPSLHQELPPQELPPMQMTPAQPPVAIQQVVPEESTVSQQLPSAPLQPTAEQPPSQSGLEPVERTGLTPEPVAGPADAISEPQAAPQPVKLEFLSEQEHNSSLFGEEPTTARAAHEASGPIDESSGWVIWSRRPQDPSHAPGVIIATRAFPPTDVVDKAVDLPTPPPSPIVKLVTVEPAVHATRHIAEPANASPDDGEAPSSSVTESTPASSTPGETPVPGSPATSRTSVSLPVTSPPVDKVADDSSPAEAPQTDVPLPVAASAESAAVPVPVPTVSPAQPIAAVQATEPAPELATPSMSRSQRQPAMPCAPSRLSVMTPASNPENAPDTAVAV